MAIVTTTTDWRWGFQHSRIICMCWSAEPQHVRTQRAKLAYAMSLGKPIRVVTLGTTRVPEDLCMGYEDFQVARCADSAAIEAQLRAWLAPLEKVE